MIDEFPSVLGADQLTRGVRWPEVARMFIGAEGAEGTDGPLKIAGVMLAIDGNGNEPEGDAARELDDEFPDELLPEATRLFFLLLWPFRRAALFLCRFDLEPEVLEE
jgi:hypothetical protein